MAGDGLKAPQLSIKDIEMDGFPEVDEAALPAQCETVVFAHSVRDTTAFRYPHITCGYRRAPSTVRECAASIFCLHNETINIWTHVLGAAIFVYLFVHVLVVSSRKASKGLHQEEQAGGISGGGFAVISLYIFSGVICFMLSALYHTFASANERVVRNFEKADHIGVLLLMLGSNLPLIYFGFVEHTHFIVLHTSMSVCAIILAIGALEFDQMRKRKLYIFVAVAAVGWAQLTHDLSLRGAFWSPESRAAVLVWIRSFACYAVGVSFYSSQAPESLFPGRFHLFFASHQLWHVCVVIGALVHLQGCFKYAELAGQSLAP